MKNVRDKNGFYTMPAELAGLPVPDEEKDTIPDTISRPFGGFIGTSALMQKIYEQIENAAKSNAAVFITGESGTGKEVCAEAIHKYGPRAAKPFVPINCAAIPHALIESELFGHVKGAFTGAVTGREGAARLADGGTLFLDEIAEMDPDMQTKLLRFLQNLSFQKVGSGKIETTNIRIICATNRNPAAAIASGALRQDLFYRLHVLPLAIPPLRVRGHDIIDIAHVLLRRYAAEEQKQFESLAPEAEEVFLAYDWPGNIRELQNIIHHIIVMHNGRQIEADMLPAFLTKSHGNVPCQIHPAAGARPLIRPLALIERDAIEKAIAACDGNILQAAAALEISPSTIYRKKAAWEQNG